MIIEWDKRKNLDNLKKHGVSFEKACEVFDDPLHLSILDKRFDYNEERWITVGKTNKLLILVVANTYMDIDGNELIRIVSARKATKTERKQYEDYKI